MSRAQVYQERARERFSRTLERLQTELSLGTPRRHLDVLVELAEAYLDQLDHTTLRAQFAERLDAARARVSTRHNLRLVGGPRGHR
jgi:hypothetical protein